MSWHLWLRLSMVSVGWSVFWPDAVTESQPIALFGVSFNHPATMASPIGTPLHPTQMYDLLLLAFIFVSLKVFQSRQTFDGQLFLLYIIFYAIGRSFIEIFRGDNPGRFVFDGLLSLSQYVSIIMGAVALLIYFYILKNNELQLRLLEKSMWGK